MKRLLMFTGIIGFLALFTHCTKGPAGPAGPQGATGPAGVVGPAGADGTVIYSGTTAPAASTGNVGDYYLDLTGDVLYGPKTASGWGTGISLVGAAGASGSTGATGATGAAGATGASGATGKAGSQIYSGTTAPATTLGTTGDYYLDVTNYDLYGPKQAAPTYWGTPIILKGATGTANVIYSDWNYAGGTYDSTVDASNLVIAVLPALEISAADLNTAVILVYFNFGTSPYPLPYTSDAGGTGSTLSFIPDVGKIFITRFTFDNSASVGISGICQFRFIIIPGGVNVPDSFDYQTVTNFYHVPVD